MMNPETLAIRDVWVSPRLIICVWDSSFLTNKIFLNALVGLMTFWLGTWDKSKFNPTRISVLNLKTGSTTLIYNIYMHT